MDVKTDIPTNTMQLQLTVDEEGNLTVSKGWNFSDELSDEVVNRCQMLVDGILLMLEFDAGELMKKAAYGMLYAEIQEREQEFIDAENAPTGENVVSLARMKLN